MTISVSTELPLAAADACRLAQKPALLAHVLWPWLTMTPTAPLPDAIRPGDRLTVRLRFLGVLPGWRHTLVVERVDRCEISSRERGGPVRAWNHTLTFQAIGPGACLYTDRVEVRAGPLTPPVALFAALIYRHRQARWRAIARVLA